MARSPRRAGDDGTGDACVPQPTASFQLRNWCQSRINRVCIVAFKKIVFEPTGDRVKSSERFRPLARCVINRAADSRPRRTHGESQGDTSCGKHRFRRRGGAAGRAPAGRVSAEENGAALDSNRRAARQPSTPAARTETRSGRSPTPRARARLRRNRAARAKAPGVRRGRTRGNTSPDAASHATRG